MKGEKEMTNYQVGDEVMVPRDLNLPRVRGKIEKIERFTGTTIYYKPRDLDAYFVRHFDSSGGWYKIRDIKKGG